MPKGVFRRRCKADKVTQIMAADFETRCVLERAMMTAGRVNKDTSGACRLMQTTLEARKAVPFLATQKRLQAKLQQRSR